MHHWSNCMMPTAKASPGFQDTTKQTRQRSDLLPQRTYSPNCLPVTARRKTFSMTKPDHFGAIVLAIISATICIFASGALSWKGRVALVLLTLFTIFVWVQPEATGAVILRFRFATERWLKSLR